MQASEGLTHQANDSRHEKDEKLLDSKQKRRTKKRAPPSENLLTLLRRIIRLRL